MHASASQPSFESCTELLRSMRAFSAFKRDMRTATSADTRTWLPVLFALHRHPEGLRIGQLAEDLHVDASVASRQFARLEASGHARRLPDPDDGRAHVLQLTDTGHQQLRASLDKIARHLSTKLQGWNDDDIAALARGLDRLTASLETASELPEHELDLASPFTTIDDGATAP